MRQQVSVLLKLQLHSLDPICSCRSESQHFSKHPGEGKLLRADLTFWLWGLKEEQVTSAFLGPAVPLSSDQIVWFCLGQPELTFYRSQLRLKVTRLAQWSRHCLMWFYYVSEGTDFRCSVWNRWKNLIILLAHPVSNPKYYYTGWPPSTFCSGW